MRELTTADACALAIRFIDMAVTATGRGTHHEKKQDILEAEDSLHKTMAGYDRGLYLAMLAMPGIMDRAKMLGIVWLLDNPYTGSDYLTLELETAIIRYVASMLPATRQVKLLCNLSDAHVNNTRTYKLFDHLIQGWDLDFMAVKFKSKLGKIIKHRYGKRRSSYLRSILAKPWGVLTDREKSIVVGVLGRDGDWVDYQEMVAFVLNPKLDRPVADGLPLIAKYLQARTDASAVEGLPQEVAQGLLKAHHPGVDARKVSIEKGQTSQRTKMRQQRAFEKAGVQVEFDPTRQDIVELYVYMHERDSVDPKCMLALANKARKIAESIDLFGYENVALVLDVSISMRGKRSQAYRPIAACEAMRDVLADCVANVVYTNTIIGVPAHVAGGTDLAGYVALSLTHNPDAVFILTDGYENMPAGRVAEVVALAKNKLGINTTVYQLSPVVSADMYGIRDLAPGLISTLPFANPKALKASMLRLRLEQVDFGALETIVARAIGMVRVGGQ